MTEADPRGVFKLTVHRYFDQLENAAPSGDIRTALLAMYASDVVAAGQDARTTTNVQELCDIWQQVIGSGAQLQISLLPGGVRLGADMASTFIQMDTRPADARDNFIGKSLLVWKRTEDSWRCVADMCAWGQF